jgi:hypothetical protein
LAVVRVIATYQEVFMPFSRAVDWMTVEPTIGLLMTITALVLFGASFARSKETSPSFWPWLRRIIEASVWALLFLGLLWAFRSILSSNNTSFQATHGSSSDATLRSAQSIWGRPHVQRELSVAHFVDRVVQEELPREDPTKPPLYVNKTVREQVPQNSILGFNGRVDMTLSEREKGYALYSGYLIDSSYEYQIINDSAVDTIAEFNFPMSPGQTLYENFKILVDNQDISSQLRFIGDQVQWTSGMKAQQQSKIVVTYASRGMDTFYYQIPVQREIKNFSLVLTVDRLPVSLLNYPEGVLTPTEIKPTDNGQGSILTWKLDRAITVAGMGVALLQPEQPGAQVLRVLMNSPYALTLLIAMLSLTLLIRGQPVNFLDLALLSGAYCVQFLIMAAVSDSFFGFWGSLLLGAFLTGLLTYLLFRHYASRLLRLLIYVLVGFFTVVYPLAGLLTQVTQRNSFDSLVQVGLIVYLFGLSLYTQLEQKRASKTPPAPLSPAE